jgi:predicted transglutaminase-like cysteine proteinase
MTIKNKKSGVLGAFKKLMYKNRLGDLLVGKGRITNEQLEQTLLLQKHKGGTLGSLLKEQGLISTGTLRVTLFEQHALRVMAGTLAFLLAFTMPGTESAKATSASVEASSVSRPEGGTLQPAAINRKDVPAPAKRYESLFDTSEIRSADISPFTKWTSIMSRMTPDNSALPEELAEEKTASDADKIEAVNAFYNKVRYIEDKNNWGASDYWGTPAEFVSRGGDCEDFAIAKYAALKNLGFKESQLRLAIVQDTWKNIPHAILIVYTDDGAKFLDNQYPQVKKVSGFDRYKPVYSINRTGWWRHVGAG